MNFQIETSWLLWLFYTGNGFYKYLPIASTNQSKKGMTECIYTESKFWINLRNVKNMKMEQILDGNVYICFMFYP